MKATEPRLRAALERPSDDVRLFLLHGPDEAGAMAWAERLAKSVGADAERVDLDGATLKNDPARLADEAASLSLFGGRRFVRVTGAGEESTPAVEALLAAERAGNPVLVIAPAVRATGALVKAVIAAPHALAYACYPPDGDQAAGLAGEVARSQGLRLSREAAARLARAADGDRAVLQREIEKLALYLDAAPDRPADATEEAIDAVGASIAEAEVDSIVAAVIGGEARDLATLLRERGADVSLIPLLRALARRIMLLAEMRVAVDAGEGAGPVMKRHRVFWRDEAATAAALRRWTPAALARALADVRGIERATMAPGNAGAILGDAALLAMTRR